jgi:integrase
MHHLTRDDCIRLLYHAKAHSERDWVMILTAFLHGLRASEVVGQRESQHGLYERREKAERRAAAIPGSFIKEVQRQGGPRFAVMTPGKIETLPGLRPSSFVDGFIRVQRLKGSRYTVQPLIEDPSELLNEKAAIEGWLLKHRARHGGDGDDLPLFPIGRHRFFDLMRAYGLAAGIPRHLCHPHVLKHSIAKMLIRQLPIADVQMHLGHADISSTGHYLVSDEAEVGRAVGAALRGQPVIDPAFYRPQAAPLPPGKTAEVSKKRPKKRP